MARVIDAYGAAAKVRRPLGVVGLTLLTLGVYAVVWYYRVNAELRDYGRTYNDEELSTSSPRASVLALVPGILVFFPPLVSAIGFTGRIRRAQRYGQTELTSGWLIAVLILSMVFIPAIPGYVQSGLNELWRRYPTRSEAVPSQDPSAEVEPMKSEPTDEELAALPPPSVAGAA